MNDHIDIRKIDAQDQSSKQERVIYFYLFYFILIRNLASNLSFMSRRKPTNWTRFAWKLRTIFNVFYFYFHIIDHCNAKYIDDRFIIEKINFYKTVIGVLVNTKDTGPIISMNAMKTISKHLSACILWVACQSVLKFREPGSFWSRKSKE